MSASPGWIVWLKSFGSVKTGLVPNAGDTIEVIEHVTSMIKANISHSRRLPSVGELLCFELVVELPFESQSLQLSMLSNANGGANRILLLIRLHRECTLGQLGIDSIILVYFVDTVRERVPEWS
jgi:hypothetical protein